MTKNNDAADVIAASAAPTTLSPTAQQQEQPLQPSLAPQLASATTTTIPAAGGF